MELGRFPADEGVITIEASIASPLLLNIFVVLDFPGDFDWLLLPLTRPLVAPLACLPLPLPLLSDPPGLSSDAKVREFSVGILGSLKFDLPLDSESLSESSSSSPSSSSCELLNFGLLPFKNLKEY